MIPYGRQEILEEDIQAVVNALKSDLITTGPLVDEFESRLTNYLRCPTFVVNSGTAALHAAYFGIGIGPGDEVITPPNTFIATQATAALLGAKIVFADIDIETGLIDLECVKRAITNKTKAIVLVDYAGQPCDVKAVRKIIAGRDIKIIQDAAHSIGSFINGQPVGSQADVTTFSFFATKNITTGEGGAVSTNNKEIFERAKTFSRQGVIRNTKKFQNEETYPWVYEVHEFGLNYRLSDILCALGVSQISKLNHFKNRRRDIFKLYKRELALIPEVKIIAEMAYADPVWHLFPIFVPETCRFELYNFLTSNDVGVQVNYIPAISHPVFRNQGYSVKSVPNSFKFYNKELSLPIHMGLSDSEVSYICGIIGEFFTNKRK